MGLTRRAKKLFSAANRDLAAPTEQRPIRVLFISISFDPEPGAVMGLPLARYLERAGKYDVQVLTAIPWYPAGKIYPGYRFRLWQREVIDGINVLRVPLYPSHDRSGFRRVLTYLSFAASAIVFGIPRIRPVDVVYYFDSLPTTGLVAFVASVLHRARSVQHIGDLWPDTVLSSGMLPSSLSRIAEGIIGSWCRLLYRRHTAITVASPGLKTRLVNRGVPGEKVSVVYTWASEDKFFPVPGDRSVWSTIGGSDAFVVLYAGNLGPLQGLDTVLAAAELLRHRPDIKVVIMGTGAAEQQLKTIAGKRGLRNVHFLSARPLAEMNRINASADALLVHLRNIPLMHNTTPSKTQIGMASARPLLMGVGGDGAALVREAGAGLTFTPESPEEMAAAICRMADMPLKEREEMGLRGREFYEKYLSVEAGANRIAELFLKAATPAIARSPGQISERQR